MTNSVYSTIQMTPTTSCITRQNWDAQSLCCTQADES